MIKFFRKIRQKLLSENKLSKYLVYAIGEIILVVIGILIALQINNWNERRKADLDTQQLITNLLDEFEDNYQLLNKDIGRLENTIKSCETVLDIIDNNQNGINEFTLDSLLRKVLAPPTWNPSTFVLNELKSSGRLSKLNNQRLKKMLFKWEGQYKNIEEVQELTELSGSKFLDYIQSSGMIRNMMINNGVRAYEKSKSERNNLKILYDVDFENQVSRRLLISRTLKRVLIRIKPIMEDIIKESKSF